MKNLMIQCTNAIKSYLMKYLIYKKRIEKKMKIMKIKQRKRKV